MADCQLGCYASFSGLDDREVAELAARGIHVVRTPSVQGCDWDASRYEAAIAAANRLQPRLVVMGGDMVDDPSSTYQYDEVMRITGQLEDIPLHWVPGNHDIGEDTVVPTEASIAAYRERFGPDHYAFEVENTAFVVVDTVVWDHPEKVPAEAERQAAWLEETLAAARRREPDHILVFGHHPPFTMHPDEPDSYWNLPGPRRRWLLDLLRRHGARAFFCGHWHRNGGGRVGEVEVAVTGPVGYPLGDDPSGFRVVDVAPDMVTHRYVTLDTGGAG